MVFIAIFEIKFIIKILQSFSSCVSISITISSVIHRKPSFVFQTEFKNCTLLLSYNTILSYNIL